MKYDLGENEVNIVGAISRDACNYYENGVYFLILYLKKSCSKLEDSKVSVEKIEEKLKKSISSISKKYPPGSTIGSGK